MRKPKFGQQQQQMPFEGGNCYAVSLTRTK